MGLVDRAAIEALEMASESSAARAALVASERFSEELLPWSAKAIGTGSKLGTEGTAAARGFDQGAPLLERMDMISQSMRPVKYAKLVPQDSKVVLFGEYHAPIEAREELIANMGQFKQMGFTHLAMEALTKERQPLMDAYFAGNSNRSDVLKALRTDWNWDPESYMWLIDEAKNKGIRILAVDNRFLEAEGREQQWAQVISDQLRKPVADQMGNSRSARILMLVGKDHVGIDTAGTRFTGLLSKEQLKPFVFDLAPAGSPNSFSEAVTESGLMNERFAVPAISSGPAGFRQADFLINLPESEIPEPLDLRHGESPYERMLAEISGADDGDNLRWH